MNELDERMDRVIFDAKGFLMSGDQMEVPKFTSFSKTSPITFHSLFCLGIDK
jgi:hypothetical protein